MICTELTTLASDYEKLRSGALEDGVAGGRFELVILLREGVAAWMRLAATRPATVTHVAAKDVTATPPIPDGLRVEVALVLANMVMTTHEERCA